MSWSGRSTARPSGRSAERILQQYRDPLLDAAHTLQGRLFNIMAQNFLGMYLNHPDPEERRYARDYTVYAIAEYLCWVEILRRELRFHDLGDDAAQPGSPGAAHEHPVRVPAR